MMLYGVNGETVDRAQAARALEGGAVVEARVDGRAGCEELAGCEDRRAQVQQVLCADGRMGYLVEAEGLQKLLWRCEVVRAPWDMGGPDDAIRAVEVAAVGPVEFHTSIMGEGRDWWKERRYCETGRQVV